MLNAGIIFAGIAKNVRWAIPSVLKRVEEYGRLFGSFKIIVVENASTDGTKEFLREWSKQSINRIHLEADHLPIATNPLNPRGAAAPLLAEFRNQYLKRIEDEDPKDFPLIAVFDCDDVNRRTISATDLNESLRFLVGDPSRAAVLANQNGFYYDIWTLRHDVWCPGDCWTEFRLLNQLGLGRDAEWVSVGARQVHIPPDAKPIEVQSAFGGFGIYKSSFIRGHRYQDFDDDGSLAGEHVSLHRKIRRQGGRLFIFPGMRTSTPYEHIKRPRDLHYWCIRFRETFGAMT